MEIDQILQEAIGQFEIPGSLEECVPFGNGHINDTYRLLFSNEGIRKQYILQKMNKDVFTEPVELMENVSGVTDWLKDKIREAGGDTERETLNIIHSRNGTSYYVDSRGDYGRVYLFIEHATCFDQVENDNDFYQSAVAFGNFQRLLADYPAQSLHETIVNFHNTVDRFQKFKEAL